MWTDLIDYESAANKISSEFLAGQGSINELSVKTASQAGLNAEGVKTLVRLANVTTFEHMFAKSAEVKEADRMIDFELGDPDVVIQNLGITEKVAHETSALNNHDKTLDYYGDGGGSLEKTAGYTTTTHYTGIEVGGKVVADPVKLANLYNRATDKMKQEMLQADAAWTDIINKVANTLQYSVKKEEDLHKLALDAYDAGLQDAQPEIEFLRNHLKVETDIMHKVALDSSFYVNYTNDNRNNINMLKEAVEYRKVFMNIRNFMKLQK
jgi:hypothetical protein